MTTTGTVRKVLLFCLLVTALAGSVSTAMATTIGVVLPGYSLVFYQVMIKGIEGAANDHHVQLLIRSPSDGASLDTSNLQLRMIDYLVRQGVAGIVLAPEPLQGENRFRSRSPSFWSIETVLTTRALRPSIPTISTLADEPRSVLRRSWERAQESQSCGLHRTSLPRPTAKTDS